MKTVHRFTHPSNDANTRFWLLSSVGLVLVNILQKILGHAIPSHIWKLTQIWIHLKPLDMCSVSSIKIKFYLHHQGICNVKLGVSCSERTFLFYWICAYNYAKTDKYLRNWSVLILWNNAKSLFFCNFVFIRGSPDAWNYVSLKWCR